jgi:hypothetical protein
MGAILRRPFGARIAISRRGRFNAEVADRQQAAQGEAALPERRGPAARSWFPLVIQNVL